MFLRNSRYAKVPTVEVDSPRADAQPVTIVKLRALPPTPGDPVAVRSHDQLDAMSEARYRDATRFWHVADANAELDASRLTDETGRVIRVPAS